MISRDIRAFVSRDWERVRQSKDSYWQARVARLGAVEAFRIAADLRRQALLQHPGWPFAEDRRRDLLGHVRLALLFRRADSTRRA